MVTSGRESNGDFAKGNQLAKGNKGGRPPRAVEEKYLQLLRDGVSEEDWKAIVQRAVKDAKGDDFKVVAKAREWLSKYLLPAVQEIVDQGDEDDGRPANLDELLAHWAKGSKN